ncbi:unnamed protein product [Polarella glacialis]|uniref:Uncharacterized protein n=1 Tax=Polarella glacialis TaxID=89957 RepID=A0A813FG31_POLGL|nr:unnamed protein product [Polarella glacialis]
MASCQIATNYTSDDDDEDMLQLDFDEACNEVVELAAELKAGKIEVEQLLMRLKSACSREGGVRPGLNGLGASILPPLANVIEEQRAEELRGLFSWLAQHADLEHPHIMDVGFEVPIGGRTVLLHRVVQWSLTSAPSGKLLLTAPIEHKEPLGNLLASTRASGVVDAQAILHFLGGWDLVAGELTSAAHLQPEPSVLLSNRTSTQGILVASWPTCEALEVFHTACPVRADLCPGDRVEVEYDDKWYSGTLHSIDANNMVSIRCQTDPVGVLTVTPLSRVRRLGASSAAEPPLAEPPLAEQEPVTHVEVASLVGTEASTVAAVVASDSDKLQQIFAREVPTESQTIAQRILAHRRTRSSALRKRHGAIPATSTQQSS